MTISLEPSDSGTPVVCEEVAEYSAEVVFQTRSLRDWAAAIWDNYGALDVAEYSPDHFVGALKCRSIGTLRTLELEVSPHVYRRTASMVQSHPSDDVFVTMVVEGAAQVVQDGRSCSLGPGDFAVVDSWRPYTTTVIEPSRLIDFAWPKDVLRLSVCESSEVTARSFSVESPIGPWLSIVLRGVHDIDGGVSAAAATRLADEVSNLLVTASMELEPLTVREAPWRQHHDEILKYIDQNIDNPQLTVETIADALYISPRSVHRVFSKSNATVASTIRDIRLEEARRAMLSPACRSMSVTLIASQFGFTSLPAFSRAFAAKYGVGPKQYRVANQL